MVAISIPGSSQYLTHAHNTLLQSGRPLQASEQVANQRQEEGHEPIRGQQGVDHETIVNTNNIFNLKNFFRFEIKLEFECVWLFRERGVFYILHIFTRVYK